MQITVRRAWLLKLLGFELADDAKPEQVYVSMHHSHWLHAIWARLTGRVRGWKHPYIHGQPK